MGAAGDDDRAKYEKMAGEDQKRSDSQAVARAAATSPLLRQRSRAGGRCRGRSRGGQQERGGDGDDGAEDITKRAPTMAAKTWATMRRNEGRMNEEEMRPTVADGEPTGGAQQ